MIKLFVTDMDGTFLHDDKTMAENSFETIDRIHKQQKKFAIASGRSYFDLKRQFESILSEVVLICNNGADAYDGGKLLYSQAMSKESVIEIKKDLDKLDEAIAIYVTCNHAYIDRKTISNNRTMKEIILYYKGYELIDDLNSVEEEFVKITICHYQSSQDYIYPDVKQFEKDYKVVVSGKNWLDISHKDVNKGSAILKLRELYKLSQDEVIVYGDFLNDLEMMQVSKHAYAPINAHPLIKAEASKIIESNNDDGVIKSINQILDEAL